jgi:hypothetical protein
VSLSIEHFLPWRRSTFSLRNTQTQKRLTNTATIIKGTTEKNILQDVENRPNFCQSVIDNFTEKNRRMEHKYMVQ